MADVAIDVAIGLFILMYLLDSAKEAKENQAKLTEEAKMAADPPVEEPKDVVESKPEQPWRWRAVFDPYNRLAANVPFGCKASICVTLPFSRTKRTR